MGAGDDIVVSLALQLADDGTSHHASVPRHVNFAIFLHETLMILFLLKR
jgi:hypothetical protein